MPRQLEHIQSSLQPEYKKAMLCSHVKRHPKGQRIGVPSKSFLYVQWQCIGCNIRSILRGKVDLNDLYLGDLNREDREQFDRKLTRKASQQSLSKQPGVVAVAAPKQTDDIRLLTVA